MSKLRSVIGLIIIHVYNNIRFTNYCSVLSKSSIITNQNCSYLYSFVLTFKGTLKNRPIKTASHNRLTTWIENYTLQVVSYSYSILKLSNDVLHGCISNVMLRRRDSRANKIILDRYPLCGRYHGVSGNNDTVTPCV